jgi:outer membrane autotransporter protein
MIKKSLYTFSFVTATGLRISYKVNANNHWDAEDYILANYKGVLGNGTKMKMSDFDPSYPSV